MQHVLHVTARAHGDAAHRHTDTYTHTQRQTNRQTDRQTDTHTHTHAHAHTHTHTHTCTNQPCRRSPRHRPRSRRMADSDSQTEASPPPAVQERAHPAVMYLRQWATDRKNWRFKKNRQVCVVSRSRSSLAPSLACQSVTLVILKLSLVGQTAMSPSSCVHVCLTGNLHMFRLTSSSHFIF